MSDPIFMKRRGVLGLLGASLGAAAAPAAAASGIGVKVAAAALGVDLNPASGDVIAQCEPSSRSGVSWASDPWRLATMISTKLHAQNQPVSGMPPHISEKRSWSRSYKAMIHSREQVILEALLERLRTDHSASTQVFKALGINSGGDDV